MRIVIQRVSRAEIFIENVLIASIGAGLLLLVGIGRGDTRPDADTLSAKIAGLRIFPDEQGKMNLSARNVSGAILIVSNFTLYGDTTKGKRPSFDSAAPPEQAKPLYDYFVEKMKQTGIPIQTGVFQAHMEVKLVNDGPVTLIL